MQPTRLYLFIGYPGAGKTTVAKKLARLTGAKHLWADVERHRMFPNPTHTQAESNELYDQLNKATEYLLAQGKSVIFDTNFNFKADRDRLRDIARRRRAETVIIWVDTPIETARERAVETTQHRNGYEIIMSEQRFESIVSKLEPPTDHENVIKITDPNLDDETFKTLLHI